MTQWLLIRRLRGPAFLLLVGITALLNQWDILSFGRSWPLYLILAGLLQLAERGALANANLEAYDPITGQTRTTGNGGFYPSSGMSGGVSGSSIVPATPSTTTGQDAGTGRS